MNGRRMVTLSLSRLGLYAPHGLECPRGGRHAVGEDDLWALAQQGGGDLQCLRCEQPVLLRPLDETGAPS